MPFESSQNHSSFKERVLNCRKQMDQKIEEWVQHLIQQIEEDG